MNSLNENIIFQSIPERKVIANNFDIYRFKYKKQEINISDDLWVFEEIRTDSGAMLKCDFTEYGETTKQVCKIIMMDLILSNLGIESIKKYLLNYKNISRFIENRDILSCDLIIKDDIDAYIEYINSNIETENERIRRKRCFKNLLMYISAIYSIDYSGFYSVLDKSDAKLLKCQIKENKKPKVPQEVFLKTIKLCRENILNKNVTEKERLYSAIVLFITQTGMRQKDIIYLEKGKKQYTIIKGTDEKIAYLNHRTFKSERGKVANKEGRWVTTYLSENAEIAYDELVEIFRYNNSNFIFSNGHSGVKVTNTIEKWMKKFYIRFADELGVYNIAYDEIEKYNIDDYTRQNIISKEYIEKNNWINHNTKDFVSIPTICQFRVSVCNELFDQGVDIYWIMKHMQHLSEEMTMYYSRNSDTERDFAKSVVKGILKDEFELLGENGKELTDRIKEFINKAEIRVEKDLDVLIEKIVDEVPIREKKYGFCIKSAFGKMCKYNKFVCAFDECPNYFTSFLLVGVSYQRFQDLIKCTESNLRNGFVNQADLERAKLIKFVNKTLYPELKQLKEKIKIKGVKSMLKEYSDLAYIINNIDEIVEEVESWI